MKSTRNKGQASPKNPNNNNDNNKKALRKANC